MQVGLDNDIQQENPQEQATSTPPVEPTEPVANEPTPVTEAEEETYGMPRGAFAFVILMTLFFVAYFFLTWTEIFVIRGS